MQWHGVAVYAFIKNKANIITLPHKPDTPAVHIGSTPEYSHYQQPSNKDFDCKNAYSLSSIHSTRNHITLR